MSCVHFVFLLTCVATILSTTSFSSEVLYAKLIESMKQEIPPVLQSGALSVANLNLNRQGNVIIATAGEKVFSTINFFCETTSLDPDALNQIVIGYAEIGAQKCILNELGYRCGDGIASFFLVAPKNPGIYEIQCRLDQAYSPSEAMQRWWVEEDSVVGPKITVGKMIVN